MASFLALAARFVPHALLMYPILLAHGFQAEGRAEPAQATERRVSDAELGSSSLSSEDAGRPTIFLTAPNKLITQSCRIVIVAGAIIRDTNDQGVIIVGASNIDIDFAEGSILRGSPTNMPADEYKGYGIRLNGQTGV